MQLKVVYRREKFQPTLPARGATPVGILLAGRVLISTHAPRTGSDDTVGEAGDALDISTHAPRTGSDGFSPGAAPPPRHFNPRSPHGERLSTHTKQSTATVSFQPTLPARGATALSSSRRVVSMSFQPTLPARGATRHQQYQHENNQISTHAPRTGSDMWAVITKVGTAKFQPTLPARGATLSRMNKRGRLRFQPTLPARGATAQSNNSVDQNQRLCTKSIP